MRIILLLAGAFGITWSSWGADYCSLVVRVLDRQGEDTEAWVTVEERDGRRLREENAPGGLRFCDLGILPVTVMVGDPACNQVIVRNVPLEWRQTRELRILYDREPCLIDRPPVAACRILYRFADPGGNWVKGVSLRVDSPYPEELRGDSFGRVLVRIAAGEELRAQAMADGYRAAELRLACTPEVSSVERKVTLYPVSPIRDRVPNGGAREESKLLGQNSQETLWWGAARRPRWR